MPPPPPPIPSQDVPRLLPTDAFNQDTFMQSETANLISAYGVKTIVETGTYEGVTTAYLATLLQVHTIEVNPVYLTTARANWTIPYTTNRYPILSHAGDSTTVLPLIIPTLDRPVLFYLDAHWGPHHPLRDELTIIGKQQLADSVIIIHDFKVPGTDLGYDTTPDDIPIDISYIIDLLPLIYTRGYTYKYNTPTAANGARRGVIYITPDPIHG